MGADERSAATALVAMKTRIEQTSAVLKERILGLVPALIGQLRVPGLSIPNLNKFLEEYDERKS